MAAEDAAVTVSLRANLKDYEAALKAAVRQTERAAKAAEDAVSGIGKRANFKVIQGGAREAGRSLGAMQADARNLSFQLNDITQGLLSGQSPFQVMIQQGSQVSQVLTGAGGVRAGLTALGSAFGQMLNPVGLLSSALILGTGYAIRYFTTLGEGAEDAEDAAAALAKVAAEAEKTAKVFAGSRFAESMAQQARAAANAAELLAERNKLVASATAAAGAAFEGILPDIANVLDLMRQMGDEEGALKLSAAFADLKTAVKTGSGVAEAATKVVAALDSESVKYSDDVVELVKRLHAQRSAFLGTDAAVRQIGISLAAAWQEQNALTEAVEKGATAAARYTTELQRQRDLGGHEPLPETVGATPERRVDPYFDAGQNAGEAYMDGLRRAFTGGQSDVEGFQRDFAEKLSAFIEEAGRQAGDISIYSAHRSLERQSELFRAAVRKYGSEEAARKWVAKPTPEAPHVKGIAADLNFESEAVKKWAHDNAESFGLVFRMSHEGWHIELANQAKVRESRKQTLAEILSGTEQQAALQERINQITTDSALKEDEKALAIARATAEAAKQVEIEKLRAEAIANDIELTPQVIADIERVASARANAAVREKELGIEQKNTTERTKEQADEAKRLADAYTQMAQSAVSGLVNDLRNGVSAGEAFNNMLNRIIDSLIEMSIQSLFDPKKGIGSLIGKLFGVAHSGGIVGQTAFPQRQVSPLAFVGAPRFATGGMVGLRAGEVPIIAHRGEMIIPRNMVGRAAAGAGGTVVNNNYSSQLGDIKIDMSQTGLVAADTQAARQFGQNVQKMIQMEMVKESRPGGLLRKVPG